MFKRFWEENLCPRSIPVVLLQLNLCMVISEAAVIRADLFRIKACDLL